MILRGGMFVGKDFTAYLGHNLDENHIYRMCHALNGDQFVAINSFVKELYEFNPNDISLVWKVDSEGIGGTQDIYGPCGFNFTFSEKVCYFHHYIRWDAFLQNEDFQIKLRKVTYELSQYFQSSFAIYVPDNATKESSIIDFIWDDENRSIEYIVSWLEKECSAPKKTFKELVGSDGYYIDFFIDIKNLD